MSHVALLSLPIISSLPDWDNSQGVGDSDTVSIGLVELFLSLKEDFTKSSFYKQLQSVFRITIFLDDC